MIKIILLKKNKNNIVKKNKNNIIIMFENKNNPYYFWIIGICITTISIILIVYQLKKTYGEQREDYALKVFMSTQFYPDFYTKWGKFPTKYLNTCFKDSQNKEGQIMDLCLRDFHIASAYRPYQPAGQTYDICSYKAIKEIIDKGARFHYLDIWSSNPINHFDNSAYPIIRNKTLMPEYGKALLFQKVCDIYKKHSWVDTKYPLILYLNLNYTVVNNRFVLHKIAEILWNTFNENLIGVEYSFSKKNIGDIPIKKTLGKVIILTNVYPIEGNLQELVNGVISENIQTSGKLIKLNDGHLTHGGIKAVSLNTESIIDYNKTNLGIVIPPDVTNTMNIGNPGIDILQIPHEEPHKIYGFNIVAMNYQKPGKERDDYINFFKESSLILKEDKLRYIPCPLPEIKLQNVKASFAPRNVNFQNGYFSHSF